MFLSYLLSTDPRVYKCTLNYHNLLQSNTNFVICPFIYLELSFREVILSLILSRFSNISIIEAIIGPSMFIKQLWAWDRWQTRNNKDPITTGYTVHAAKSWRPANPVSDPVPCLTNADRLSVSLEHCKSLKEYQYPQDKMLTFVRIHTGLWWWEVELFPTLSFMSHLTGKG